jgi:replicative DNA helicase
MFYKALVLDNIKSKRILVPENDINSYIKNYDAENYASLYKYSQEQYEKFMATGTIAGIRDVVGDTLLWDFDSSDQVELAQKDAKILITRLQNAHIKPYDIQLFFSGKKGFTIQVFINKNLSPDILKNVCVENFGKDLPTLDKGVYDAARIIRVPFTKHPSSGLYKIGLSHTTLSLSSVEDIKKLAISNQNSAEVADPGIVEFNEKWIIPEEKKPSPKGILTDIPDMSVKPKDLTKCRYFLQNGFFNEGNRSKALLCLAATYKNNGYPIEMNYRMLKGVAEIQANRTNTERYPDDEIYNNIVSQVYRPSWKNGQYTCREKGNFLYDYCQSLGQYRCDHRTDNLTCQSKDVFSLFNDYADNFDKNILYTGIQSLDERMKLMVGTTNAIVAPPGVGKTSLALQLLNHNSNQDIHSIFFSYDMYHAALYVRMMQRLTGFSQDKIYDIFKNDKKQARYLSEKLNEQYKNVHFCFRSGQTSDEIKETIIDTEQKIGDKVKLIVIDYNELVVADVGDPTAASSQVAQKIREIANEQSVCALTLLQPSKLYSSPADEIISYNSAKGSSSISQAQTLMLGLSRPGFSPLLPETDKFFNITCLKNRNGGLFSLDFTWDGLTGTIGELTEDERGYLSQIRQKRADEKAKQNGGNW